MDNKTFLILGIAVALIIGVAAVFLASGDPDGLESTALMVHGQKTLTGTAPADAEIHPDTTGKFVYTSPMPDYSLGEKLGPAGSIAAIAAGTLLAFGLVLGISRFLTARKNKKTAQTNQ
jgi:cobalt/nickel transport protein